DYPTIATGPQGAPSVWVAWWDPTNDVHAAGARVTGRGADKVDNFGTPSDILQPHGNSEHIAVGPKGQVLVTALMPTVTGAQRIGFAIDPDGLGPMGFRALDKLAITVPKNIFPPVQPKRGVRLQPKLAWDVSGKFGNKDSGRVYLV